MRIAVITPYHREPLAMLERCHASVAAQTHRDVEHLFVADGHPHAEIDGWPVQHLRLPHCGDMGDTPRATGAAVAAARGADALAFLDADCWYEPRHLERLAALISDATPVVTCARRLWKRDGAPLGTDDESDGVAFNDTNCYLLGRRAFGYVSALLFKRADLSLVGDRVLWQVLPSEWRVRSSEPTVNYTTHFAFHYQRHGLVPPPDSRVIHADAHGRWHATTYADAPR